MLEPIKASGVTPMALDENAIIWQILSWWQAQMLGGADQVGEIVTGETQLLRSDPDRHRHQTGRR